MMDVNGQVIEGTMTNLFFVKEGTLYTASLDQAGVAGIMRGVIIELAAYLDVKVIEHRYSQDRLLAADEIFVCNAIIGIWPIKRLGDMIFTVGPVTRRIQNRLAHFKNEALLR